MSRGLPESDALTRTRSTRCGHGQVSLLVPSYMIHPSEFLSSLVLCCLPHSQLQVSGREASCYDTSDLPSFLPPRYDAVPTPFALSLYPCYPTFDAHSQSVVLPARPILFPLNASAREYTPNYPHRDVCLYRSSFVRHYLCDAAHAFVYTSARKHEGECDSLESCGCDAHHAAQTARSAKGRSVQGAAHARHSPQWLTARDLCLRPSVADLPTCPSDAPIVRAPCSASHRSVRDLFATTSY